MLPLFAALPVHFAGGGNVWVVDQNNGPGTEFTTISAAVAAAGDGDVLLIRSGDYRERPVIDGKGLVLQEARGAVVSCDGLTVQNLIPGQAFVAKGLRTTVGASDDQGLLLLQDVEHRVVGGFAPFEEFHLERCTHAVLPGFMSDLTPAVLTSGPVSNLAGVVALDGSTYLYDSTVLGLDDEILAMGGTSPGGFAGIYCSGFLRVTGCDVRGWIGGYVSPCAFSGPGGAGIESPATPPSTTVERMNSSVAGGPGGKEPICCFTGPTGPAFKGNQQIVVNLESARSLDLPSVWSDGKAMSVIYEGRAGDTFFLHLSCEPSDTAASIPGTIGYSHLAGAITTLGPFGPLASHGTFTVDVGPFPILSGAEAQSLFFQAEFVNGLTTGLTGPHHVLLFDRVSWTASPVGTKPLPKKP